MNSTVVVMHLKNDPLSVLGACPSLGPCVRPWTVLRRALDYKSGGSCTDPHSPCDLGQVLHSLLGGRGAIKQVYH